MAKKKAKQSKRVPKARSASVHAKIVNRIQEVIVPPATKDPPVLVTPLPQKEVRDFGAIPFEQQANLVFQTFPADAAEIIGTTKNSGPGSTEIPAIAGK